MSLFSSHMAIDLGTVNTLVYTRSKGVVLNEPTVVAMRNDKREVLAVGEEARRMIGRTPGDIVAVRPLSDGVISDYDITEILLKHFIRKAAGNAVPFGLRGKLVLCVPSGITEVEKRAVESAARSAGARDVLLMDEPMAAALGAGVDVYDAKGCMVADMGGGTTEIAVISLGGIVLCKSLRVGGNHMDEAIADYVKKRFNLFIGEMTAERVKIELGSVYEAAREERTTVRGRNVASGLPAEAVLNAAEVREALSGPVKRIVQAVRAVLEQTPPELASDIIREGMVISGGTACLKGLNRVFAKETGVPVRVAPEPLRSVINGAGIALDDYFETKRFFTVAAQASV